MIRFCDWLVRKIQICILLSTIIFATFCFQNTKIPRNNKVESYILLEIIENNKSIPKVESQPLDFTVLANRDWQDTGFNLTASKNFSVQATGIWYMTLSAPIPPEGLSTSPALFGIDYRLDKNFNHGQLLCRNSTRPEIHFSIGDRTTDSSGRLFCRINDTDLLNNSGSLKIFVLQ